MDRRATSALGAAAVALGLALRLAQATPSPGDFDEVSFLGALERWDLLALEPHFPGYPLTVLLARGAAAAGAATPYAWVGAGLTALGALALLRVVGGAGGLLACGLLCLAPPAVREGARPLADAPAMGLLALALAWTVAAARRPEPRRAWPLGLLLGAVALAKPDHAVFLPLLVLPWWSRPRRERAQALGWGLAGLALPAALALAALPAGAGGWGPLLAEGRRFLWGHATRWGGGVLAAAPGSAPRAALAAAPLGEALGATAGPALLGAGLVLCALGLQAPQRLRRLALLGAGPYLAWLLLGQNLAHPRHTLALLPFLALLAGSGLARLPAARPVREALLAALLLAASSGSWRDLTRLRAAGRPLDRLTAEVAATDALTTRVYAGRAARVLAARLPGRDVRQVRDLEHVRRDLAADPCPPPRVLLTSELDPGPPPAELHLRPLPRPDSDL